MAKMIDVFEKATGNKLGEVPARTTEECREAVKSARAAQKSWAARSYSDRAKIMLRFRDALLDRIDETAKLLSQENGKTLQESVMMEIMPIADLATYFAKNSEKILSPKKIPLHLFVHRASYVHYKPRGVILLISPWNFPFTIPTGEVIMALMAGNAVVHKPASLTPLIAMHTRKLFDEAGLPPDIYQVVTAPGRTAMEMVGMGVDFVSFTGSTDTGKLIASEAGKYLLETTMELGGKDPAIVCEDANLNAAANSIVFGALANSGQVCASIERVYAVGRTYDPLVEKIVERVKRLRQGNPLDDVDVGAMTDEGQVAVIERQVDRAREQGAQILTGGKRLDGPGLFYPPTVITGCTEEMDVIAEETFGPVIPVMRVSSIDEAIQRSNNSKFGLDAYVFTKDREQGRRIAEKLDAGTVQVNDWLPTHAAPETPWGGVKESGIGRVHGDDGLRHLCEKYHVNYDRMPMPDRLPISYPYSKTTYNAISRATKLMYASSLGDRVKAFREMFGV